MGAFLNAFASKRVGMLIALGFASGLPLALTRTTLSAWMTNAGVNLKTIGLFSLVTLPYSFKFVWAPLLDRFSFPLWGRRRGWMALAQLGLLVGVGVMSTINPQHAPLAIAGMAVLVAFFSASQDVAADAYRTDVLPLAERASGTSTWIMGYRIAMLVSGAGALVLSDHMPWSRVYLIMALLMGIGIVATWLAPEPETVRPPRTIADAVVKPFVDFFTRKGAALALIFVMLYRMGDTIAGGMVMPFLIKRGFSNSEIGYWNKGVGFAATIVGVMLGGGLVAKFGVRRCLLSFGALAALANTGYLALALHGKSVLLLAVAIGIDNVCGGMVDAAFAAFVMSLCNKSFSATQFALLSSASTIIGRLMSAGSGWLAISVGWPLFFALTIVAVLPSLVLLVVAFPKDAGAVEATAEPKAI
jgi:MFS transporter, PAT family, beta-lactamase induction signal transducer AmpG